MIKTNNGEVISITPLLGTTSNPKPYSFQSLTITESIFGEVPEIVLEITSDQDMAELNSVHTINIKLSNGSKIEATCYLYDISYSTLHQTLKLLVCDSEFTKVPYTNTYQGFDSAISSCYNGEILNKPFATNNIKLYQRSETNLQFLNKILLGYKKDTLFGFSISGLKFLDLNEAIPIKSYQLQSEFQINKPISTSEPASFEYDTEVTERYTNHSKIRYGNHIIDVNNDYADLLETSSYNRVRSNKNIGEFSAETRTIHPLELLDLVTFNSTDGQVKNYYIVSKVIVVENATANTKYILYSINPNEDK